MNKKIQKWVIIRSSANNFYSSTKSLHLVSQVLRSDNRKEVQDLGAYQILPFIVLKAFTCELYLKSILQYQAHSFPRKHDLLLLYNNLPEEKRDSIYKDFLILSKNTEAQKYSKLDFKLDIEKISNTFEDVRYFYENKLNVDVRFMNTFCESLRINADRLKSEPNF